jgi:hypothetical protein
MVRLRFFEIVTRVLDAIPTGETTKIALLTVGRNSLKLLDL